MDLQWGSCANVKYVSEVAWESSNLKVPWDKGEMESYMEQWPNIRKEVESQRISVWTENAENQIFPLLLPHSQYLETTDSLPLPMIFL
jgi:hypothetical protein